MSRPNHAFQIQFNQPMKSTLYLLFVLALFVASCQQEHEMAEPTHPDHPLPGPELSLVESSSVEGEETKYFYDHLDRQIKAEYADGFSTSTYFDDYVLIRYFESDGSLSSFTTMEYNADGRVGARTVSYNASYREWYEYNDDGQVSKTRAVNGNDEFINTYYYSNGNLDSTTYYQNGQLRYTYYNSYYTNHLNNLNNDAFGQSYRGKESRNLMKQWYGRKPSGEIFIQASFAYTFDAKNRVATQTQIFNDDISTFSYTYIE